MTNALIYPALGELPAQPYCVSLMLDGQEGAWTEVTHCSVSISSISVFLSPMGSSLAFLPNHVEAAYHNVKSLCGRISLVCPGQGR